MKVVVINGSPRRDGLVSQMLGHVAGALPEGCEVETLFVRDMQVRPCTGCMKCRSLGRCVLPEADVKVYLTASSLVRARRRYRELTEKGIACDLKEIEQDILDRDHRDMHREHSPLVQAEDAVYLDSSDMTLDQVVDAIGRLIDQKIDGQAGGRP